MSIKRAAALVTTVLATTTGAAVLAAPAQANWECIKRQICVYDMFDGQWTNDGNRMATVSLVGFENLHHPDLRWGDRISSFKNVSGRRWCFYVDHGYEPTPYYVNNNTWGNFSSVFNNKMSSMRPC